MTEPTPTDKPENKSEPHNLEEFFGCMDFDGDPLEIQKRMRDEWNGAPLLSASL